MNAVVVGRPANDGQSNVWYAVVTFGPELSVNFIPVEYDFATLAAEMRREGLPEEFAETISTGWWTTCLEILPAKERERGKY